MRVSAFTEKRLFAALSLASCAGAEPKADSDVIHNNPVIINDVFICLLVCKFLSF